ncbi:homoprotocatechuate degradation operon regulator HpaR [Gemmobacter sp.]|uniref:homoprotocatechuate degradation operon regulator HpaR n=1 Tax=Gemmobacter sp. TaxID=1898957 RepID=UPI002AFEB30F|nr:homoprotocatechuate degradation operon regulator HpaR [Gemmobacter sp.]
MAAQKPEFFPTDVHHSLPMALLRARESVMRRYRPMLEAHGVNEQQWRVLRVLAEEDQLDASEVAARANILAPSLTRMIRSMVDKDLIERGRDDGDGRRVMLKITPAGLQVIRTASPESRRIYREIEAQFGHDRMALLVDLLNDLSVLDAG